jgi:hypothetical protein
MAGDGQSGGSFTEEAIRRALRGAAIAVAGLLIERLIKDSKKPSEGYGHH